MALGYINFALGVDYKPLNNFSLLLSPISTKLTFARDDSLSSVGAFGVDSGKNSRLKWTYLKIVTFKNH